MLSPSLSLVQHALWRMWQAHLADIPCIGPGMNADLPQDVAACQMFVHSVHPSAQRSLSTRATDVLHERIQCVVHLFQPYSSDLLIAPKLADRIRQTFCQQTIPIIASSTTPEVRQTVGWLRFDEGVFRDLTYFDESRAKAVGQHLVVEWSGQLFGDSHR